MDETFVPRLAQAQLQRLVAEFRVVVLNGPRQAGKTTLLKLFQEEHGGEFRTLDDPTMLEAALSDPTHFVRSGEKPLIIDEIHRGGNALVLAIKLAVDQSRGRGQFVLAGSTNFLTVPTLSESLAGRAVFLDLWQLAQAELAEGDISFAKRVFSEPSTLLSVSPSLWDRAAYLDAISAGGYPEVRDLGSQHARRRWFDDYLTTVINRDITEFAELHRTQLLPELLTLIAARAGSPLVVSDLMQSLNIDHRTVQRYLSYLETVFLTSTIRPWTDNHVGRVTKAPKTFPMDSGLASRLLRVEPEALRRPGHPDLGRLVEIFAYAELRKLASLSENFFTISHYRDRDNREIDFILEGPDRRIVAVEVKASESPSRDSARHLHWLRDQLGDRFAAGIVFYLGDRGFSWGDRVFLLPLSALWGGAR